MIHIDIANHQDNDENPVVHIEGAVPELLSEILVGLRKIADKTDTDIIAIIDLIRAAAINEKHRREDHETS